MPKEKRHCEELSDAAISATKTELIISINYECWEKELEDIPAISNLVLAKAFEYIDENEDLGFPEEKPLIFSLVLTNDEEIQELNKEYRGKDSPTNVLSFANLDNDDFDDNVELFDEIELGDIIISLDTMKEEAEEAGISLKDHYCHIFLHGVLHLLGFDHEDDEDAFYMEEFETNILHSMDIENPY